MEDNPKDEQVFKTYWRGLDKNDTLVSFNAQMAFLPKIWIIGQFVPAFVAASYLSIKFFGSLNFYKIYIENAVILVFALVTNISFLKRSWEDQKVKDVEDFNHTPSNDLEFSGVPPSNDKVRVPKYSKELTDELARRMTELENQGVLASPEVLGINVKFVST